MRARLLAGLLLLGVVGGCSEPYAGGLVAQSQVRVYLLRGLWDVFSTGFDTLALDLKSDRVSAVSMTGPDWPTVIDELRAAAALGQKIVLAGHSYGGDDAIRVAETLGQDGIDVDLVVLLDATSPAPVPANVHVCIQYYIPTDLANDAPDVFPGNPVALAPGNDRTLLRNLVFTPADFGAAAAETDHFNIESNGFLHSKIRSMVDSLAKGGAAQEIVDESGIGEP